MSQNEEALQLFEAEPHPTVIIIGRSQALFHHQQGWRTHTHRRFFGDLKAALPSLEDKHFHHF